jgi:hypothetical protein
MAMNACCGIVTLPICFMRFLPCVFERSSAALAAPSLWSASPRVNRGGL